MQDARAHVFALQLCAKLQQHGCARLQHVAILREAFGEQHRLEMPGRIGQAEDAHLVAGLGAPLHARDHGRRDLARGRAGLHRAGELRPGLHAQPLQRRRIVVERMARQEEADRIVFLLQLLLRQPRLDRGQDQRRRVGVPSRTGCAARWSRPDDGSGRRRGSRRRRQRCARGWARSQSNAPAAARLSITRLFSAFGGTREAKSASEVKARSPRASTISSHRRGPHALQRRERVVDRRVVRHRTPTPERLIDGGSILTPSRCASARNSESLSVLFSSSVIDAARNSTG